jgi:hypothetical protein
MVRTKAKVTQRALIQRINRALLKDDEMLRYDRRDGSYMHINIPIGFCIEQDVNINALAKKLKVLKPWETTEGTK